MRYIGHFLCVSYELHKDLRSYMGWEVHRGLASPAGIPRGGQCLA